MTSPTPTGRPGFHSFCFFLLRITTPDPRPHLGGEPPGELGESERPLRRRAFDLLKIVDVKKSCVFPSPGPFPSVSKQDIAWISSINGKRDIMKVIRI